MEQNLTVFLKKIGIKVSNPKYYHQAFIHRSFLNENKNLKIEHNERLEFLGDAVLELSVTEYLFSHYPNPEGDLTNWRSAIVKGEMLVRVARSLELDNYLRLSKGEQKNNGKARDLILANAFEALIGAIYLDLGYASASEFVGHYLIPKLGRIIAEGSFQDSKSKLQELVQNLLGVTPSYTVLEESGPDHNKEFIVGVMVDGKMVGKGNGSSKQKAEQIAAKDALGYYK